MEFYYQYQTNLPLNYVVLDTITETIEKTNPDNGSNNWAISGAKSITGNPILANDPHLGLNLPSIWMMMQLCSPTHNVMGTTIPGALSIILGLIKYCLGETNATRDVIDWYKIEFNQDRTRYLFDDSWKDVRNRLEEIKIQVVKK